DAVAETVLVDVVVQSKLEREPHLLELVRERNNVASSALPVRRRPLGSHVHDRDRRWRFALAREGPAANVAQSPPDDLLWVDVDDEQGLLEFGRAREHAPLVLDDPRESVQDQLVLPRARSAQ